MYLYNNIKILIINRTLLFSLVSLLSTTFTACSDSDDTVKEPITFTQPLDTRGNRLFGSTHIIAYTENNDIYINDYLSATEEYWGSHPFTSDFNSANGIGSNSKSKENTYSYLWNNEKLNIYAYHVANDKSDLVSLEGDQLTYTFDNSATNCLYIAEPLVMNTIKSVCLRFTQVLTNICFDFICENNENAVLTNIEMESAATVTFNIKTKDILSTSGKQTVSLATNLKAHSAMSEDNNTNLFVSPNLTEIPMKLTFLIDNKEEMIIYHNFKNSVLSRSSECFKSGQRYKVKITYASKGIEISEPIISNWTNIGSGDIDL